MNATANDKASSSGSSAAWLLRDIILDFMATHRYPDNAGTPVNFGIQKGKRAYILQVWGNDLKHRFDETWTEVDGLFAFLGDETTSFIERVEIDPGHDERVLDTASGTVICWEDRVDDECIKQFCRGLNMPIVLVK